MKPGGTEGGSDKWIIGFVLMCLGLYLLFDSVKVSTGGHGLLSGLVAGGRRGHWDTTSMGVIFVPFIISMIALFVNASRKITWYGLYVSLGVIVVEMFSRVRFMMHMKTSSLLLITTLFCAGCGLMIRGYLEKRD